MLKEQKGITLVALVITVIVLLILAGTAVTLAIGGDGIFTKSNESVQKYNNKVNEQDAQLTNVNANLDTYYNKYINAN